MIEVKLNEAAQSFLLEPLQEFKIPELKATVFARGEYVFIKKKEKLFKKIAKNDTRI